MISEQKIKQKLAEAEEGSKGVSDLCHRFELAGVRLALLTVLGILNETDWDNRMSYLVGKD